MHYLHQIPSPTYNINVPAVRIYYTVYNIIYCCTLAQHIYDIRNCNISSAAIYNGALGFHCEQILSNMLY